MSAHNGSDRKKSSIAVSIEPQNSASSSHRSEADIACDVLDALSHGMRTRAMLTSATRLPRGQIDRSLRLLTAEKLIAAAPHSGRYGVTKEGLSFADYAIRGVIPPTLLVQVSK